MDPVTTPSSIPAPEQVAKDKAARADWEKAYNPAATPVYKSHAEAFAEHMDCFDQVLGYKIPEPSPADVKLAKVAHDHGINAKAQPADYALDMRDVRTNLDEGQQAGASAALRAFASKIQINPIIGVGLLGHIAETGAKLKKMTVEEQQAWMRTEEKSLLAHCGSEAALKQIRQEALAAIALAGDDEIAAGLKNGIGQASEYVVRTLANHMRAYRRFEAARPKS